MKQLVIFGAGGHGKVVADIASDIYEKIIFFDHAPIKSCLGYPVFSDESLMEQYVDNSDFFVAIGSAKTRERIMMQLEEKGAVFASLVHPSAIVGKNVSIGEGTVIMAGAVLNPECEVGRGCIINTSSSVDHDCNIADYVHVSVGAHVCGTVSIGKGTWIGAGATISNNINVCGDCMLGAGAVVVKDIKEAGTYVGVPARKIG